MTVRLHGARASRVVRFVAAVVLSGLLCPSRAWARQAAAASERVPTRVSVDLSTAYDRLDAGFQPWRELSASVAATFAPRAAAFVGVSRVNRFGRSDAQLIVGGSLPVSAMWTIGGELHGSESKAVFARMEEHVWVHRRLPHGWGAQMGVQRRAFTSARVETATAVVERYFGAHRVSYQAAVTSLRGAGMLPSQRVGMTYGTRRGDAVTLAVTHGSEADIVGVGRVLLMSVRALDVWGVRPITPHWMMTYSVGVQQQGTLYNRTSARLGIRRVMDVR
jgi:YaiO family outer membrane protein